MNAVAALLLTTLIAAAAIYAVAFALALSIGNDVEDSNKAALVLVGVMATLVGTLAGIIALLQAIWSGVAA